MKKILAAVCAAVFVFAVLFISVSVWHKKQVRMLEEQIAQNEIMTKRVEEAKKKLQEEYDIAIEEKSGLEQSLHDAMEKIDSMIAEKKVVLDAQEIESQISEISELATIEYRYTNVGVLDEKKQFSFWNQKIPFTGKCAVIVMDGTIKAGIDFSKVKVATNNVKKTVTVAVPASTVLSNELDEGSMTVVTDEQSIFNKLTQEDHNNLRKQIKEKALDNVEKSNALSLADERAKLLIKDLIESIPNVKGNYEVKFENAT